ncbi:hypothetical protein [Haloferula sp. A504]|uniref:hypothetical protein n=1 Tax=Haloferula sp. A504 TaxID=3373601 RepID=UPI0037BECF5B
MIGIDFGPTAPTNNFNQVASTEGGGAAFNTAGTITAGNIIDTSNVVVDGVEFSWANGKWSNNDAADSSDLPGQNGAFDDSNLTDWIGENNNTQLILTFSGLNTGLTYDLLIGHGFVLTENETDTTFTVGSQSATNDHGTGSAAYVTLNGLSPDEFGTLVITTTGNGTSTTAPDLSNLTAVAALQLTATVGGGQTAFEEWATRGGASGVTFDDDANDDGVLDGMAFLLGADTPATDATGLLPTADETGGDLVMAFSCLASAARGASVLNLEYDGDLAAPWLSVPVPGAAGDPNPILENTVSGSVSFVATDGGTNGEGDALVDIVATITDATESAAGKVFGRLNGTE